MKVKISGTAKHFSRYCIQVRKKLKGEKGIMVAQNILIFEKRREMFSIFK